LTGSGDIVSGGSHFKTLTVSGVYSFADAMAVDGNLNLTAGSLEQGANLGVSGNYVQTGGTFTGSYLDAFTVGGSFSVPYGDGAFERYEEVDGVKIIRDLYDLQAMKSNLSSHFMLNASLDAISVASWNSNSGFDPIGDATHAFTGNLNGNEKEISNLKLNRTASDYVALFGQIGVGGVVSNLALEEISVYGKDLVGGLAGLNRGSLSNVYTTGAFTVSGENFVGGLVGENQGSISNAYSSARVKGNSHTGGLVGANSGTLDKTYGMGFITDQTGQIPVSLTIGGLVGSGSGSVTNSYWDKEMTGQERSSGGTAGRVIHMITDELGNLTVDPEDVADATSLDMMKSATYGGWDFGSTWVMDENGTYPHFQFRYPEGVRGIWGKVLDESGTTPLDPNKQIGLYVSSTEGGVPGAPLMTTKTGASSMFYFVMGNEDVRIQPTDFVVGGLMDPDYSGNTRMPAETGSITNLDIWGHLTRVIPHPQPAPNIPVLIPIPMERIMSEVNRSLQDLMDGGGILAMLLGFWGVGGEIVITEENPVMVVLDSEINKRADALQKEVGISFDANSQFGREQVPTRALITAG
ncbi:MAG: GLUG motif-containing protein, partial [Candidatus Omnitrophota bacterium]